MSVLRPGTRDNCRVSVSSTSKPWLSSTSYGGIQYTPVLSIATHCTFHCFNHSAIFINSGVVLPKVIVCVDPSWLSFGCFAGVGSEVARLRAGHRPPLKLYVQFSR